MKILFMVDYWMPKATTNAVCAKNVALELQKKGNDLFVCAFSDKKQKEIIDDGIKVNFVKPTLARTFLNRSKDSKNKFFSKLYKLIGLFMNRIRRIVLLPIYPIVSLSFAYRWCNEITKIIKNNNIDCVVSMIAPDDSLYTGYLCKKANPSTIWIPYYLDNGSNLLPGASFEKIKSVLNKKYQNWENKILEKANGIIVMNGHEKYYRKILSTKNSKKLYIADVPLFVPSNEIDKKELKNKNEVWMYAGNMCGKYYDPHTIVEVFNEYNKDNKAHLKLFGPTDEISYIENQSKNNNIKWYGNVSHDILIEEYLNSDVLVYYKNGMLDSVSGKFFEYIKYGKIVIYIGNENDINAKLTKKYDKGLVISNSLSGENLKKLFLNIDKLKAKNVDNDVLLKNYKRSTPEFSAKIIIKIILEEYSKIN